LVHLVDLSLDAFCVAGFDGYVTFANPAFTRILGHTEEELLARPFLDTVHPADVESVGAVLAEFADGKDSARFACRHVCADGSVRWLEWSTRSVPEQGVVYGMARDATDGRGAAVELDALRRVATLVAERVQPQDLFAVVAEEVSRVVDVSAVSVVRYELDGTATECANFHRGAKLFPTGARWSIEGTNILRLVRDSAKAARINDYAGLEGEMADIVRRSGIRSTVGVPIVVAGRLWGTMVGSTTDSDPLPADTAARLADFTELLATAIGNAESREALERLADEQAALRRVATLVARGAPPAELFAAVTEEAGQLLPVDSAAMGRYDPDGMFTTVAAWSKGAVAFPVGRRWVPEGRNVTAIVFETGRSARLNDFADASGAVGVTAREAGYRSAVGTPIMVEGRLWGVMTAASSAEQPLPPDTEVRLASFTELVATAIANTESRAAVALLAKQQAALRRVATLVAEAASPVQVFSAIGEEVNGLLGAEHSTIVRLEGDGEVTMLASCGIASDVRPLGTRFTPEPGWVLAAVIDTGLAARNDDYEAASEGLPGRIRSLGIRSSVAAPIVVEGALWGVTIVATRREHFPEGTEQRLEEFTALAATAIANAESRSELAASRRRIVAASDDARRRIERDLHDGTQQRLVSLTLGLRAAEADVPPESGALRTELSAIAAGLTEALTDLQELSRGIHPAILSQGGLVPALRTLARRSTTPVDLDLDIEPDLRLPAPIEVGAYFVASEALANATKHAQASRIEVSLAPCDGSLRLSIRDDGVGGADAARGSGLVGLTDRVEALGGTIEIESALAEGTSLVVTLPLEAEPAHVRPASRSG
jgi:PAS domain S-box-containing protein